MRLTAKFVPHVGIKLIASECLLLLLTGKQLDEKLESVVGAGKTHTHILVERIQKSESWYPLQWLQAQFMK